MAIDIKFSFTTNVIGGYEVGDGEYFCDTVDGKKDDFIILTEETQDSFILSFLPCKMYDKYIAEGKDWECEDHIHMATHQTIETYLKKDLVDYFTQAIEQKDSIGIYKPVAEDGVFHITNFWFYYANLCEASSSQVIKLN